jgi:hypothetical protein
MPVSALLLSHALVASADAPRRENAMFRFPGKSAVQSFCLGSQPVRANTMARDEGYVRLVKIPDIRRAETHAEFRETGASRNVWIDCGKDQAQVKAATLRYQNSTGPA